MTNHMSEKDLSSLYMSIENGDIPDIAKASPFKEPAIEYLLGELGKLVRNNLREHHPGRSLEEEEVNIDVQKRVKAEAIINGIGGFTFSVWAQKNSEGATPFPSDGQEPFIEAWVKRVVKDELLRRSAKPRRLPPQSASSVQRKRKLLSPEAVRRPLQQTSRILHVPVAGRHVESQQQNKYAHVSPWDLLEFIDPDGHILKRVLVVDVTDPDKRRECQVTPQDLQLSLFQDVIDVIADEQKVTWDPKRDEVSAMIDGRAQRIRRQPNLEAAFVDMVRVGKGFQVMCRVGALDR